MNISVLVTTFNRASYLRLCLLGYLRQKDADFEVIVSDDGSTDETPEVVEEFKRKAPFPVAYLWREHEGHRRAEVINRAIVAARGDWLVFSDCDSVPHHALVSVHRREADPKRLLCGGRIRLDEQYSRAVTPETVMSGARVIRRTWEGHVAQKNYALEQARCDWILCIDADERVSPEFAAEIREILRRPDRPEVGWSVPRKTWYLGRWITHGGWRPDRKRRLVRCGRARWGDTDPHDHLATIDKFTAIGARQLRAKGRTVTVHPPPTLIAPA